MLCTMVLFRLNNLWDMNARRFALLFQLKESHGSSGIYSFSAWAHSNLIIRCLESDKNWKEELVLLEGVWAEKGTPSEDLPELAFHVSYGWVKPTL